MSVDWYPCDVCGKTFPDCGDYVHCNDKCYHRWCSDECAEKDGFVVDYDKVDEYGDPQRSCNFCRKEDVGDSVLLQFLLERFVQSDREAAVKEYFNFNGRNK